MIVREVEGVDRIRVRGRGRHIRIEEARGVGPGRPDGETASVHGVPGDAAAGRRPREGDSRGGRAHGAETGGGGGGNGRGGRVGVEEGAHPDASRGGGKGGPPLPRPRGAPLELLRKGGARRRVWA